MGMGESQLGTTLDVGTSITGTQLEDAELAEFGEAFIPNIDECLDAMEDMSDESCS